MPNTFFPDAERSTQSRHEEALNSGLHVLGLLLALGAARFLLMRVWPPGNSTVAISAFALPMVLLYLTSAVYHALPSGRVKQLFQIIDRAAIYLLIAGTYTPVCLLMLRDRAGIALCVAEWGLALGGIAFIVAGSSRYLAASAWIYQIMGSLSVLVARPLWDGLPHLTLLLLGLGGIAYVVGVLFLLHDRIKYFHALSHVFVMLGTGLQFWAIGLYLS